MPAVAAGTTGIAGAAGFPSVLTTVFGPVLQSPQPCFFGKATVILLEQPHPLVLGQSQGCDCRCGQVVKGRPGFLTFMSTLLSPWSHFVDRCPRIQASLENKLACTLRWDKNVTHHAILIPFMTGIMVYRRECRPLVLALCVMHATGGGGRQGLVGFLVRPGCVFCCFIPS